MDGDVPDTGKRETKWRGKDSMGRGELDGGIAGGNVSEIAADRAEGIPSFVGLACVRACVCSSGE